MRIILSLFLVMTVSCSSSDHKKVIHTFYKSGTIREAIEVTKDSIRDGVYKGFYENGKVEEISNYLMGNLHGVREIYYEDGKVKAIENYVDGKMNGSFQYFFDNGNIETVGNARNGLVYGRALNFFKQDSGKVSIEAHFLIVKGESVRTSYVKYDPAGDTIEASPFIDIELADSIPVDSEAIVEVRLINPTYKFTHFVVGDFNEDMSNIKIDLNSGDAQKHRTVYTIDTSKKGLFYFRGIAIHHSITEAKNELLISEGDFNIYFEKEYRVF